MMYNVKRGSELPWAKLNEDKVAEIRATIERREALKAELKQLTNAKLAEQHGVHIRTIDHISAGWGWVHV